ncbi:MAG: M28 family peptidase [Flavobacteriales bacterium]|nr:M28 family peptidase [Flavobacteriales bacterium]
MEKRLTRASHSIWGTGGIFFLACILFSCDVDEPKKPILQGETRVVAPEFSADSAYTYIAKQVDFGPRVPNSPEHVACGDWLSSELNRHGAEVTEQIGRVRAYDGSILKIRNIIGSFLPDAKERVMLYAHWDTRPYADKDTIRIREPIDGANDGGSGVGVLLEIARVLGMDSLDYGVDIILFDAEDYGTPEWADTGQNNMLTWCLGSQFWVNQPHRVGYQAKYGILLDMVGAENAVFNKEGTSMAYAPATVKKVWRSAQALGYGDYFQNEVTPQTVDDNLFVSELGGIPSANIVHYQVQVIPMGYGPFHHTHADNMEVIHRDPLNAVGSTILDVLWND